MEFNVQNELTSKIEMQGGRIGVRGIEEKNEILIDMDSSVGIVEEMGARVDEGGMRGDSDGWRLDLRW